jgi:hypothetical protein
VGSGVGAGQNKPEDVEEPAHCFGAREREWRRKEGGRRLMAGGRSLTDEKGTKGGGHSVAAAVCGRHVGERRLVGGQAYRVGPIRQGEKRREGEMGQMPSGPDQILKLEKLISKLSKF